MTSKISILNQCKHELKRKSWMIALSILGNLICGPILFTLIIFGRYQFSSNTLQIQPNTAEYFSYFQNAILSFFSMYFLTFQLILVFIGAIIASVFSFNFLFSKKRVDLFHSLPIKREKQFFINYITSILIWIIPFLVFGIITLLFGLLCLPQLNLWWQIISTFFKLNLFLIFAFLCIYHTCLLAIMISGNYLNTFVNLIIIGCSVAMFYGIFSLLCSISYTTFYGFMIPLKFISWLSPIISTITLGYALGTLSINLFFTQYGFLCIAAFIFMILQGILSLFLYKRRESELAERGTCTPYITVIFKTYIAYILGIFGGIFVGEYMVYTNQAIGYYIFGAILFSFLTFGFINIIYEMNYKSFLSHGKTMISTIIFCVLTIVFIHYDIFTYDAFIPQKENIQSITVLDSNFYDSSKFYSVDNSNSLVHDDSDLNVTYTNIDEIYALLAYNKNLYENKENSETIYDNNSAYTSVKIELKNGMKYYRTYRIYEDGKEVFKPFIENSNYIDSAYMASSGLFPTPDSIRIYNFLDSYSSINIIDKNKITKLYEIYSTEFKENYSIENLSGYVYVAEMEFLYISNSNENNTSPTNYITLNIPEYFTKTLSYIKELAPNLVWTKEEMNISSIRLKSVEYNEFVLEINNINEIQNLLPYLHLGLTTYESCFNDVRYVYVGEIIPNSTIQVFIDEDTFPEQYLTLLK